MGQKFMLLIPLAILSFFSRRRRHTRFKCDWSSDVCSSDPHRQLAPRRRRELRRSRERARRRRRRSEERRVGEEWRSRGAPYHLKKKKKNRDAKEYRNKQEMQGAGRSDADGRQ